MNKFNFWRNAVNAINDIRTGLLCQLPGCLWLKKHVARRQDNTRIDVMQAFLHNVNFSMAQRRAERNKLPVSVGRIHHISIH